LPHYCQTCEVLAMCNGACPKDRFLLSPEGEEGLNYLCTGYKRFFLHCRPFLEELSTLQRLQKEGRQQAAPLGDQSTRGKAKTGRNDPCPCSSGKKYKKCCGR
jgi:serine-type anaerobic sulfatase-maturating enzyme